MFELFVDIHRVEGWIAGEHLGVVGVHQRADPGVRLRAAQAVEERRGADEVADVVAADD
jgi:hypothetical protein